MSRPLPGLTSGRTIAPREILFAGDGQYIPGGVVLDAAKGTDGGNAYPYELRAGWLLGQITATGLYVPLKRTTTSTDGSSGVTTLTLGNPTAFQVGDSIMIGAASAVAITAVNYATGSTTIAASRTFSSGAVVRANDGSETFRGILAEFAKLRTLDNAAAANASAKMFIGGTFNQAMILGDLSAALADANARFENFKFVNAGVVTR